ncbi:MAG: divergent polysaccharide deacetylase family protein [Deltaproteobacteria bacterium]|nr:divergent polysaccharide deacetylase family protein [Deltaproteobacteria bacterium]
MGKSGKGGSKKLYLTFIGFVLTSTLILIVIYYLQRFDTRGTVPPFEEGHHPSGQSLTCIGLIDKAISGGFQKMGVPREKVLFLPLVPTQKDDHRWNFTSIEARIPRSHNIFKAGEAIRQEITALTIPVHIAIEVESADEIIYNLYCKEFHTHRLKLAYETAVPSHRATPPRIAIIIDDLGYDKSLAREFIDLDIPLTLSILPFTPYTNPIAQGARAAGREIMLHLPMEPRSYPRINPGDGVLLVSMERDTIRKVLEGDLGEIPYVAGVNNHMGSRFTENKEKMTVVLSELKRRGLYFVDSKTSRKSVAYDLAKQMKIRAGRRDVFLDNDLSKGALEIQTDRLLNLARHNGHAIGIGHPHKETLGFLTRLQLRIKDKAEVVPVSGLLGH